MGSGIIGGRGGDEGERGSAPVPETAVLPLVDPSAGVPFGPYVLLGILGSGGMADVLLAERAGARGPRRLVALKRIHPHLTARGDQTVLKSLRNEFKVGRRLAHPNVVRVYELAQVEGQWVLEMEYVPGRTLHEVVEQSTRGRGTSPDAPAEGCGGWPAVPPRAVGEIAVQVLAGLAHAHDLRNEDGEPLGLVHRDLTPRNVMVDVATGRVKVLDFGIARAEHLTRLSATGTTAATVGFASPEHLAGHAVDGRSDLFSLGACLYLAATGRALFDASDVKVRIAQVLHGDLREAMGVLEAVYPALGPPIRRLLARDVRDRPRDAEEASREWSELLPSLPGPGLGEVLGRLPPPPAALPLPTAGPVRDVVAGAARGDPGRGSAVPRAQPSGGDGTEGARGRGRGSPRRPVLGWTLAAVVASAGMAAAAGIVLLGRDPGGRDRPPAPVPSVVEPPPAARAAHAEDPPVPKPEPAPAAGPPGEAPDVAAKETGPARGAKPEPVPAADPPREAHDAAARKAGSARGTPGGSALPAPAPRVPPPAPEPAPVRPPVRLVANRPERALYRAPFTLEVKERGGAEGLTVSCEVWGPTSPGRREVSLRTTDPLPERTWRWQLLQVGAEFLHGGTGDSVQNGDGWIKFQCRGVVGDEVIARTAEVQVPVRR